MDISPPAPAKRLTVQAILGAARKLGLPLQNNQGPARNQRREGLGIFKPRRLPNHAPRGVGVESADIDALVALAEHLAGEGRKIYHPLQKRYLARTELNVENLRNGTFLTH